MKKILGSCFLVSFVFVSSPMDRPYDKILLSFWDQVKCKGFGKEENNSYDMLRAQVNIPYWNYLLGKFDHTTEKKALEFFERFLKTDDLITVNNHTIRPHVCLLDAWDDESPQYIANNYVQGTRLLEMYVDVKNIVQPSVLCKDFTPHQVNNEAMLLQWIEIISKEPGFEQDPKQLFKVYKRFALGNMSNHILLLAVDNDQKPIGAISSHMSEDISLAGIFSLSVKQGFEAIKKSLVWECIKRIKDNVKNDKLALVYLGLQEEYNEIFDAMKFNISREIDLYRFDPNNENKKIQDKK